MTEKKLMHCGLCGGKGQGLFCGPGKVSHDFLNLHKAIQKYNPGQHLFDEGSPAFAVYCIHDGLVKVYKSDTRGDRHVIRLLRNGDILGFRGLLANEPYAATAEAVEKTTACVIPRAIFIDLLKKFPDLLFGFLAKLAEELRISEEQMLSLVNHPVRQRVASLLLTLIEDHNPDSGPSRAKLIRLKRNEMAQIIGTTPESLSRTLSEFARRKIIDLSYSEIFITDKPVLEKIADQ